MGGEALVYLVIVVVLGVVVVFGLVPLVQRFNEQRRRVQDEVKHGDVEAVRYQVPEGQDPAVVMAALRHEGFEPVGDQEATAQDILVPCSSSSDRDRVRRVIASAPTSLEGGPHPAAGPHEVRFTDE